MTFKTHHIAKMTEEKQILLNKIDHLLTKRTAELRNELPDVHEVNDGIIIRFFADWDNCEDDAAIKYKQVPNIDDPDKSTVFFYIPKGSSFDIGERYYIGCINCLNGAIEITANNETKILRSYTKTCINSDNVTGMAYENTYLIVTSNKNEWSEFTLEHQKSLGNIE